MWPQRAIIHSIHPLPVKNHRLSVAHDLCFDLVGVQHYKNIAQNQDKAGFLCAFNYSSWNLNNCLSFCRTTAQCVVPISGRYNTGGLTCSPLRPLCLCVKTPQTGAHFWTQGIVLSYHTDCRVTRCGDWSCHQVWQSTPAVKRLFWALANPIENISSSDSVFMLFPHCEARNTFVFTWIYPRHNSPPSWMSTCWGNNQSPLRLGCWLGDPSASPTMVYNMSQKGTASTKLLEVQTVKSY